MQHDEKEGDRIAGLRSPKGALISAYAGRPSPGGFGALLTELVKPLREEGGKRDRDVLMSVREDAERIRALEDRLELDSAPGYAIFASDLDDIFVLQPLDYPAPNVSTLGPRPYMRPLRAAPRSLRSGVIVADQTQARTYIAVAGHIEELSDPISADPGNRSFGGFSGYDEQTARSRADELATKVWREAVDRLLERHLDRPFDYLAIGSHEESVEEIARNLHPYLARLKRETFVASPTKASVASLRAELDVLDRRVRRDRHGALAGRVCDTAWSGGNAVLGLRDVLEAANAQAIDTLVVAGPFARTGAMCDFCGYLARTGSHCPVCSHEMFPVDDIVGAAMDATVTAGGNVSQISVASPLDTEGVGALTRFPVRVPA